MWQRTHIAAFSFLAVGFGLAGGTAQAAPQVLGLQASLQPTKMICTEKGCRADLSAFCLQQQRSDPKPGTVYHLAPGTQVTLLVTGHDGRQTRLDGARYLSFTDDRGFVSITARVAPGELAGMDVAAVAIDIGQDASLLPAAAAGDTNPQASDELALATGANRHKASVFFDKAGRDADAIRLTNAMLNALPEGSRNRSDTDGHLVQQVLDQYSGLPIDHDGALLAADIHRACVEKTDVTHLPNSRWHYAQWRNRAVAKMSPMIPAGTILGADHMESADLIWPFALAAGASEHPKDGACLMSVVSWLVYGDLSDQPACVSEVVAELARSVNDLLPDYRRQALKSYIPRLIDTNDGASTERARLRFVHRYIIEKLFPLGLAAAGLEFLIPVVRRVAPNHLARLKPFVDEIVGQALRDPQWPEEAMTVLQSRVERGLWVQGGTAAPETIGSVLESIALAMELKPAMASQFYDGLVGMLDGVLGIGRSGVRSIDHAVAEERIQAFAEAA